MNGWKSSLQPFFIGAPIVAAFFAAAVWAPWILIILAMAFMFGTLAWITGSIIQSLLKEDDPGWT